MYSWNELIWTTNIIWMFWAHNKSVIAPTSWKTHLLFASSFRADIAMLLWNIRTVTGLYMLESFQNIPRPRVNSCLMSWKGLVPYIRTTSTTGVVWQYGTIPDRQTDRCGRTDRHSGHGAGFCFSKSDLCMAALRYESPGFIWSYEFNLTFYVPNFSEGSKTYIYTLCHSSTLTWHR